MNSRKDIRTVQQLEILRNRRLDLADIEIAQANAAVETAVVKLADARASLARTAERCRLENQRLNEELSNGAAKEKDRLFEWKQARERLRARVTEARASVTTAKLAVRSARAHLEQAKQRRRPLALDVERLKALLNQLTGVRNA